MPLSDLSTYTCTKGLGTIPWNIGEYYKKSDEEQTPYLRENKDRLVVLAHDISTFIEENRGPEYCDATPLLLLRTDPVLFERVYTFIAPLVNFSEYTIGDQSACDDVMEFMVDSNDGMLIVNLACWIYELKEEGHI